MPGFTVQRSGFTHTPEMAYAIVADMIANGFVQKFPAAPLPAPVAGTPYTGFKVTLEPSLTVDSLQATQPWRIAIDCITDSQQMDVYIATPTQLPDDGTVALLDVADSGGTIKMPAGMLNVHGNMTLGTPETAAEIHFIARNYAGRVVDAATAQAYPMSYALSITDHGVAVMTWEEAADSSAAPHSSWFVAQRPVDHLTGAPLVTGHAPVMCLFSMVNKPFKFIVREDDVLKPTRPVPADADTEDSHMIINSQPQVVIAENNRYIVVFPNGLNTPRYMYTEELDMVAYTSADVVSQFSDISMTVYGEPAARIYKAMQANALNNTGMRILMIKKGAGIL